MISEKQISLKPQINVYSRRVWLRHVFMNIAALSGIASIRSADALMPQDVAGMGLSSAHAEQIRLTSKQISAVQQWIGLIVQQQLRQGPSPRWLQHDCVGLVRFACSEALRPHDMDWLHASGLYGHALPTEPNLTPSQITAWRHSWWRADGQQGAYVSAMELVQYNCVAISRDINNAQVSDLLLFDQGNAQHLMIWMGHDVAYHTGSVTATDNGLRTYPIEQLIHWNDTRWQPQASNPNFLGIFRLQFLAS